MGRVWRVTEEEDTDAGFIGGIIIIGVIVFIVGWIIKILAYVLPVALVVGLIIWIVKASKKAAAERMVIDTKSADEVYGELTRFYNLLKKGAITQAEYDEKKSKSLSFITDFMEHAIRVEDPNVKAEALNKLELWHSLLKDKIITQAEYEEQKDLCLRLVNKKK